MDIYDKLKEQACEEKDWGFDERVIEITIDGKERELIVYTVNDNDNYLLTVAKSISDEHGVPDKLHFFTTNYALHEEYTRYALSIVPSKLK